MKKTIILLLIIIINLIPTTSTSQINNTEEREISTTPCPKPYIKVIKPKSTIVGKEVVIRGHRFGNDEGKVIFEKNILGEIIAWRNQRIVVKIPQNAVTGKVRVVNSCESESNSVYLKIKIPEEE